MARRKEQEAEVEDRRDDLATDWDEEEREAQAAREAEPEEPEQPEEAGEGDAGDEAARGDPGAALHQEREKRREARTELEERDRELAELKGRLEQLTAFVQGQGQGQPPRQEPEQPPGPQFEQLPDMSEDYDGYMRALGHNQRVLQDTIVSYLQQQRQREVEARGSNDFFGTVGRYEVAYAQRTPDYPQAYQHLVQELVADKVDVGFDPASAQQAATQELIQVAYRAMQARADPAEALYRYARRRGFGGGPPKAPAPRQPQQQQRRQPSREAMAEGELPSGGGGGGGGDPFQQLMNADMDELMAGEVDWRKALGGR